LPSATNHQTTRATSADSRQSRAKFTVRPGGERYGKIENEARAKILAIDDEEVVLDRAARFKPRKPIMTAANGEEWSAARPKEAARFGICRPEDPGWRIDGRAHLD
jgi:hypothetical protein